MSNSPGQAAQNAQKAAAFFGRPGLPGLVMRLYEKYAVESQVRGQIILSNCTPTERREIASFLGKPLYTETTIRVKLVDVEKALLHSFNCTLPAMLRAYFPERELVTRIEQRARQTEHQSGFQSALAAITAQLPLNACERRWLEHGQHGEQWLYSRYKNAPLEEQELQLKLIAYVAALLAQLPRPDAPERLALFAQRTSGDPHMLDPNRAAGRLFLLALSDLANSQPPDIAIDIYPDNDAGEETEEGATAVESVSISNAARDREQELFLYTNAGLQVDTISSNVAVYNLAGAYFRDGTPDTLPQAAGARVLLLPLRQLQAWQSATSKHADIYVVENPQVFEEIIAALQARSASPTLLCTSGWPSVAALTLLDLLLSASPTHCLYYSGDFDARGLQIAAYLQARYPGRCHPWRFDPDSYMTALQPGGIQASAHELDGLSALPQTFDSLIAFMRDRRTWAYQEGITQLLIDDITCVFS